MASIAARFRTPGFFLLVLALSAPLGAQIRPNPDLVAHEWGTFTSIAGRNGQAEKWSTLKRSTTLPSFVEHFSGPQAKAGLQGTVRMETPVLYFYSPCETAVSVKVRFSKGLITEWYPQASHIEPNLEKILDPDALYHRHDSGSIAWDSVTVSPTIAGNFPRDIGANEEPENQYYAARETAAAPLLVKTTAGNEQEKFLFYRGVSRISVPISATVTSGEQVRLTNLGQDEIPSVILFERRGDKLGYRLGGALSGEMSLDRPELTATLESMSRDFQDVLIGQGLYPDEARAMIATWRQSWFEEGSRLFYIVPSNFLTAILPLTINPAPSQTVRVFVGRVELVTPATTQAVAEILAAHDIKGLRKYNRFLEPIFKEMKDANPAQADQMEKDLDLTYQSIPRQSLTEK